MEATGVYWKPVWPILSDGDFALSLANAAHVKTVPGRKTDVNDATWLADLLAHGLVRASFVPDAAMQEQRGLLRTRTPLVRERRSPRPAPAKDLGGRQRQARCGDLRCHGGEWAGHDRGADRRRDRSRHAGWACPTALRTVPGTLREALRGRLTSHHRFLLALHLKRFLLALHLKQIDALDEALAGIDREVNAQVEPFRAAIAQLKTLPGISDLSACVVLAEIGHDMTRVPTQGHLLSASALGICSPGPSRARGATRVRASAAPAACARAGLG